MVPSLTGEPMLKHKLLWGKTTFDIGESLLAHMPTCDLQEALRRYSVWQLSMGNADAPESLSALSDAGPAHSASGRLQRAETLIFLAMQIGEVSVGDVASVSGSMLTLKESARTRLSMTYEGNLGPLCRAWQLGVIAGAEAIITGTGRFAPQLLVIPLANGAKNDVPMV